MTYLVTLDMSRKKSGLEREMTHESAYLLDRSKI